MLNRTVVLGMAMCVSVSAQTQRPAPPAPPGAATGTGVISGVLVRAGSADPLRKAPMRISSTNPGVVKIATTDQDGRFLFEQLPPADYTLTASKPGFLEAVYGASRPGPRERGTAIRLGAGQKIETISFALSPSSTISGTIRDEFGDPASQVPVRALRFGYQDGERTLTPTGTGTTDDRGQYRIPNLVPGEYLVTAVPRETAEFNASLEAARRVDALMRLREQTGDSVGRDEIERLVTHPLAASPLGYVPVYFPSVLQPSASSAVMVGLSEEVGAIDLRLQVAQVVDINGIVTSAEPLPAIVNVQLVDPAMPLANFGAWFRKTDKDGRFTFTGIVPGTYVLRANATMPATATGGPGEMTVEQHITVAAGGSAEHTLRA